MRSWPGIFRFIFLVLLWANQSAFLPSGLLLIPLTLFQSCWSSQLFCYNLYVLIFCSKIVCFPHIWLWVCHQTLCFYFLVKFSLVVLEYPVLQYHRYLFSLYFFFSAFIFLIFIFRWDFAALLFLSQHILAFFLFAFPVLNFCPCSLRESWFFRRLFLLLLWWVRLIPWCCLLRYLLIIRLFLSVSTVIVFQSWSLRDDNVVLFLRHTSPYSFNI